MIHVYLVEKRLKDFSVSASRVYVNVQVFFIDLLVPHKTLQLLIKVPFHNKTICTHFSTLLNSSLFFSSKVTLVEETRLGT
jgi:hypothetical protein